MAISLNAVTRAIAFSALKDRPPRDDSALLEVSGEAHLRSVPPSFNLSISHDLAASENEWRRFETFADCTPFQKFVWLASWYRHVGRRARARPAIVIGRFDNGETAFLLPLCVVRERSTSRLCWLGQELCDYNAPLLAPDFWQRATPGRFLAAWRALQQAMLRDPLLRHDWIAFQKMPQKIGAQFNPFIHLGGAPHASGVHLTNLGDDWEKFYTAKRSSATRRRDRTKRRHMSEYGEMRFVTASHPEEARCTVEILMEQKSRAFARKGIADLFAPPEHREFYLDVASNPETRQLVHISRIDIGTFCAAANLGIVFRDCYYHVLASFADNAIGRFGPGALHLRELMAYAIGLGLKRFDFTVGDEPYKLEWSDTDLKLYDYTAPATWRGFPSHWSSAVQLPIKRFIKQTPLAWRLASHVRSAIASLSQRRQAARPARSAMKAPAAPAPPLACVIGNIDLLRPVGFAGIACAAVGRRGSPALYSRYTHCRLICEDVAKNDVGLVDALVRFGKMQSERPVLFYQEDAQLVMLSRFRERLAEAFRFVIAGATLVEDLVDKARFHRLAERQHLPVPPTRAFHPAAIEPHELDLRFPVIIKPFSRTARWEDSMGLRKALAAANADALSQLWPQLLALDVQLVAQELIPGTEAKIESYHCYIDQVGGLVADFTGRKIRTHPLCYGHTTALEITEADDVRRTGRSIVERLELTGVAKIDFKRDPQGNLRLLEINPRFNLWHHAGALAGVNIPALVYADLAGLPRPPGRAKAGVRWCCVWRDFSAARESGVPLTSWVPWVLGCEAKSTLSWDDPLPFLRSTYHRAIGKRFERAHG